MNKLILAFTFVALFAGSASAQRKIDERRAMVPTGFVRIFMLSGSVTVTGWDQDSLVVTGTVFEPAGDRFAIGVTPKGAKMGLWTDLETGLKPSHINVRVPYRSQVWVKTMSADIRISNVAGGVDLFSVSGTIEVNGSPREVYAETMGGDIALNATTKAARLKTASGSLKVSGAVNDLTAVTVSGPIDVTRLGYQRARIESVDGAIRYAGRPSASSDLEVTNHAGSIDLFMPRDVAGGFSLSLYSGEFVDEFGVAAKYFNPKQKTREANFSLGVKSAARVTLRSFKGRVALRRL
jgi:hypothetical protein